MGQRQQVVMAAAGANYHCGCTRTNDWTSAIRQTDENVGRNRWRTVITTNAVTGLLVTMTNSGDSFESQSSSLSSFLLSLSLAATTVTVATTIAKKPAKTESTHGRAPQLDREAEEVSPPCHLRRSTFNVDHKNSICFRLIDFNYSKQLKYATSKSYTSIKKCTNLLK